MELTVGTAKGDLVGDTNQVIQAALDRVASLGGGRVRLGEGTFVLRDALRIGSRTHLSGEGEKTILLQAPGWERPLWEDGDWGDVWVRCGETGPLPPVALGDGVLVCSDHMGGWHSTVGTVLEIDEAHGRFRISTPFCSDFMVHHRARVSSAHPMIAVENAEGVEISDLTLDGNRQQNSRMDSCRGGGVWGLRSPGGRLSRLAIRNINGDGVSFQKCHDWVIDECTVSGCAGGGFHPGTGAQRPTIRRCISRANGGWGIFVCWQVKHGVFEGNLLEGNEEGGISIGHKDTNNLFRANRILNNHGPAIHGRPESFPMAPHRCTFEANTLQNNHTGKAQVVIEGPIHDWLFRGNRYGEKGADANFQVAQSVVNLVKEPA